MKILLAGEGGQGVQVVAEILAKAAFMEGKGALYIPNFGVEQRGGVSLGFVVLDEVEVAYPKFEKAEILVVFCDRALERIKNYIGPETRVILSPAVTLSEIDGIRLKSTLSPKAWNIVILGKILGLQSLVSRDAVKKVMEERFAHWFEKQPELRELDFKALDEGATQ
ncbi:2-oxoacid:acceptor oxidoreductase family protein [Candidatus Microgenomates bacterium]|nr:2-oxoacid:acceptor oxidoreductase family protein [Candidatus Microgenomates bacterium]